MTDIVDWVFDQPYTEEKKEELVVLLGLYDTWVQLNEEAAETVNDEIVNKE
jgi:hypothetical protein